MKNLSLLFFISLSTVVFAQNIQGEFDELVQAEKRAAAKKMRMQINPNTYNYDVVYHRLDLTVDPAEQ